MGIVDPINPGSAADLSSYLESMAPHIFVDAQLEPFRRLWSSDQKFGDLSPGAQKAIINIAKAYITGKEASGQ